MRTNDTKFKHKIKESLGYININLVQIKHIKETKF